MKNRAYRTATRAILTGAYAIFAAAVCLHTLGGTPDVFHSLVTVPLVLLGVAAALVALERFLDRPAAARERRPVLSQAARGRRPRVGGRRRAWTRFGHSVRAS